MNIKERITALRKLMEDYNLDAYIINGTDPHLSEYLPGRWKTREWISGFTGSYGRVVVTRDNCLLWTDSRYFIQATDELKDTGILLMKERLPDSVAYEDWLCNKLEKGSVVGVDGKCISVSEAVNLESKLMESGIILNEEYDLFDIIWDDRPKMPSFPAYEHFNEFAGQTREEKLKSIREELLNAGAESTVISSLDDLAWTFNIRGNDIEYNPVVTGFGYIDQSRALIFISNNKLPAVLKENLINDGVEIREYSEIFSFLESLECGSIFLDPDKTNITLFNALHKNCKIVKGLSIPCLLKSVKNPFQVKGMQNAHRRDGAAMIKFLYWLEKNIGKERITELAVCKKLSELRAEQLHFKGESFHTIAGYAEHGAIVHYRPTGESDKEIIPEGFLLLDSGGQYLDGTTDITRTISLGNLTYQQKTDFTLVLKGMIQLSMAKFPAGTKGANLDILARKALWDAGMNYGHGTGHGIGHFLNVHEGPVSIRQEFNSEPLRIGQVASNEPGLYREGEYGIRIENVIVCCEEEETDFGKFLRFDTLTLCPIEKDAINANLLSEEELKWLNSYHDRVYNETAPLLSAEVNLWLKDKCSPIKIS